MRRWSILTLPLAGALYTIGVLLRGPFVVPDAAHPAAFVAFVTAGGYVPSYVVVTVAAALGLLGFIALHVQIRTTLSAAGMSLAAVGYIPLAALFGFLATAFPALGHAYQGGDSGAIQIAVSTFSSGAGMGFQVGSGVNILGALLFAIALWRRGSYWRAAALPFVLGPILQAITAVFAVEMLGQVLLLAAGLLIAYSVLVAGVSEGQPGQAR